MVGIFDRVIAGGTQYAIGQAKSVVPRDARKNLPLARKILTGDVNGIIDFGLNEAFARLGLSGTNGPDGSSTARYSQSMLLGGITMREAKKIFDKASQITWAKKNLWNLRITNLKGATPMDVNLFAVDVSYPGFTVQGDKVLVGSGSFDVPTNSDAKEMRITTFDDLGGTMKQWFKERHSKMCHADGTFGLPVDYLFRVDVMHAVISDRALGANMAYVDTYFMRPGSLDNELSRREDGLVELAMSFVEFDTFAGLV